MVQSDIIAEPNILETKVSGKITKDEWHNILAYAEDKIKEQGKVRWLVVIDDLEGWEPSSLLEDAKFDIKHRKDYEKVAIVGEALWEKYMTKTFSGFFAGEVKYFEHSQEEEARKWIKE